MTIHTTYSKACVNLAELCDEVTQNNEIVVIDRGNEEDVALISATELTCLLKTAHSLRSPRNAKRLLKALERALSQAKKPVFPDNAKGVRLMFPENEAKSSREKGPLVNNKDNNPKTRA